MRTYVDLSTTGAVVAEEVAAALGAQRRRRARRARSAAASPGPEARTLAVMAAGDAAVFERVRPLLELFGKHVVHVGDDARPGPDREAPEQPALGDGARDHLRGGDVRRRRRPRSRDAARRLQRRHRAQHRDRDEVPRARADPAIRVGVPARADGEGPRAVPRRGAREGSSRCRSAGSCSSSGRRRRRRPTRRRPHRDHPVLRAAGGVEVAASEGGAG